jgi:hypothetical protein
MDKKLYVKILLALVLSFGLVKVVSQQVFIADTPKIQPNLAQNWTSNIKSFAYKKSDNSVAVGQTTKPVNEALATAPTKELIKGVYAREDKNVKQIIIRDNEIVYTEYTFTINGKEIKIKVPQGEEPPPKEVLEKIY